MAQERTNKGKGCLVGFLVTAGIILIGVVAVIVFLKFKGDDVLNALLTQTKEGVAYLLTEDHTPEEKAEFEAAFEGFIDSVQREGFQEGVRRYQGSINELQTIIEDQRITRHESEKWLTQYRKEN